MTTIGIDIGTTHTVLATNGRVIPLVPVEERVSYPGGDFPYLLPSVVSYPEDGSTLVGGSARSRRAIDPMNTIRSAKRIVGARWGSEEVKRFEEHYPHQLVRVGEDAVGFRTRHGIVEPADVEALIVRAACRLASLEPHDCDAVVTVPVAFDEAARAATAEGARRAGLREVTIVEEPVATALAYVQRSSLRYAAVYDLGGGTFDVAIIECDRYPFTVVGHAGDAYLGGDDIDHLLADAVASRYRDAFGWDLKARPEVFDRLVLECEVVKCALTEMDYATIELDQIDPMIPTRDRLVHIDQARLLELAEPLIAKTLEVCDEALAQAGVQTKDIQAVFTAGGGTRLLGLNERLRAYFGKRPRSDLDPMHVVGIGASYAAARPKAAAAVVQVPG
ncbi:MAG: Hsp70 family protein [Myxococcales bacterium]|nr:Hsp70 family protein [Myxococcales bacterium]